MRVRGHYAGVAQPARVVADVGHVDQGRSESLARRPRHQSGRALPGRVTEWDVVNEVLGDNGALRSGFWLIGSAEYIELAFRTARAADPTVGLCSQRLQHRGHQREVRLGV